MRFLPGRKQRKKDIRYDKRRYKRRNRVEIMFGTLKDWRRVATRYDRCPKVFISASALAAIVTYWQRVLSLGENGKPAGGGEGSVRDGGKHPAGRNQEYRPNPA